jgi:predicted nucleic acid-binding protein
MIVVSDTSPINYLVLMDRVDVLRDLFGEVFIPQAVYEELTRPEAPEAVRRWIAQLPRWVEVRQVETFNAYPGLGWGESEAIQLAISLKANVVLLDDYNARVIAKAQGLFVTGVIEIIEQADIRGWIEDLPGDLEKLVSVGYWIKKEILEDVLDRYKQRRMESR